MSRAIAWTLVGAAGALGAVSLGWLLLAPAMVAAVWLLRHPPRWPSALGLLFGAGVVCFGIAFLPAVPALPWLQAGAALWSIAAVLLAVVRDYGGRRGS